MALLLRFRVASRCAKMKNCCQTCLLDLQYGLPTQFRDAAFGKGGDSEPKDNLNKAYIAQNAEGHLENVTSSSFGKSDPAVRDMLKKLARQDPNYNKNRPKPCSFYAKGDCNRGDTCSFRHEVVQPQPGPSISVQQSIQNRCAHGLQYLYPFLLAHANFDPLDYGTSDPAAQKLFSKTSAAGNLTPPADQSILSLFVSQLPEGVTQEQVHALVPEAEKESVKSVTLVSATKCGFVNFKTREAAENVAKIWSVSGVQIEGAERPSKAQWGRSKTKAAAGAA